MNLQNFIKLIIGESDSYNPAVFLDIINGIVPEENSIQWILEHGYELFAYCMPRFTKMATMPLIGDIHVPGTSASEK